MPTSARERASIEAELTPPFLVHGPRVPTTPFVFCSPHSGRVYPRILLETTRLDPLTLRRSEDCYVDELFEPVTGLGAPLICARFPRAYLDVNREPFELDPELFDERPPSYANTHSMRVAGGLGTIPRVVADSAEIYRGKLRLESAFERINALYTPFHAALQTLIDSAQARFGFAILIDCHSMPSPSLGQSSAPRPDVVLGDRFGTSCDARLTRLAREILSKIGYDVQLNRPYAGGYITEHYGQPARKVHALQIEINRSLYLNPATLGQTSGFAGVRHSIACFAASLFAHFPVAEPLPAAAE